MARKLIYYGPMFYRLFHQGFRDQSVASRHTTMCSSKDNGYINGSYESYLNRFLSCLRGEFGPGSGQITCKRVPWNQLNS